MSEQSFTPEVQEDAPVRPPALERILGRGGFVVWSARVERWESGDLRWDLRVNLPREVRDWLQAEPGEEAEAWREAVHPDYAERVKRTVETALLNDEDGYEHEFPMAGGEGRVRWMHEMVEIERCGEGSWSLAGLVRDISQRKKALSQLEETKARFELVFKNSKVALRLTDADGMMVAVNPVFCEMVGMTEEELLGRPLNVIFAEEEDLDGMLRRYRQRFRDGNWQARFERPFRLANGYRGAFEFTLTKIEDPGIQPLCFTVIRDITAQKESDLALRRSEAFFRSVWEGSTDGLRLTDENGTVLAVNDAFCGLMGCSREMVVGKPFTVAYDESEDAEKIVENYRKNCRENEGVGHFQARLKLRDGRTRDFELALSMIESDVGKRVYLTNIRDVTERKQAQERRLKMERKMLDAQRLESLGVLAGGIAHDFNNLLTAILGNASLALMQLPESSTVRPFLTTIEKTSMQAADLCKQMLAYSGRAQLEMKLICLNSLLEEMNHLLQVSISKQIVLRFHLEEPLPQIEAESSEIQQIVMNLIINASEAIGTGGGTITISTGTVWADREYLEEAFLAPDLPEGQYVTLEVSDTGTGMSPETQARIFDPFFTTKFTGRGLGLAAVRGIVQRHRGTLKVYSELNSGTTFKLLLPAVPDWDEGKPKQEMETRPKFRRSGTVLVADDEQAVRAVTARMLEACGMTVLLAKDGGEAVEIFHRHRDEISLVILDMTMPVLGGSEAFGEIRRMRPEQKVLLMSGYTEMDATDRFGGQRLSGFLQKPFKWEALEAKLREILPEGEGEER